MFKKFGKTKPQAKIDMDIAMRLGRSRLAKGFNRGITENLKRSSSDVKVKEFLFDEERNLDAKTELANMLLAINYDVMLWAAENFDTSDLNRFHRRVPLREDICSALVRNPNLPNHLICIYAWDKNINFEEMSAFLDMIPKSRWTEELFLDLFAALDRRTDPDVRVLNKVCQIGRKHHNLSEDLPNDWVVKAIRG